MTIHCVGLDEFIDVIAGLVAQGLTFSADARSCTITLLGGY